MTTIAPAGGNDGPIVYNDVEIRVDTAPKKLPAEAPMEKFIGWTGFWLSFYETELPNAHRAAARIKTDQSRTLASEFQAKFDEGAVKYSAIKKAVGAEQEQLRAELKPLMDRIAAIVEELRIISKSQQLQPLLPPDLNNQPTGGGGGK